MTAADHPHTSVPIDGLDDAESRLDAAIAEAHLAAAQEAIRRRARRRRERILEALEACGFPRGKISKRHEHLSHLLGQADAELAAGFGSHG